MISSSSAAAAVAFALFTSSSSIINIASLATKSASASMAKT